MSREVTARNPSVALAKEDKKCHVRYIILIFCRMLECCMA